MSAYDDEEWDRESDAEGLVHPLPLNHDEKRLGFASDNVKKEPSGVLSLTSASDDGSSELSAEETHIDKPGTNYPEELVRLHTRRAEAVQVVCDKNLLPPPAPIAPSIIVSDIDDDECIEAQKRVMEYRRRMNKIQEEQKEEKTRAMQAAKQVRTMYKAFNRTIGVADVPSDARYKEAVRAKRMEKQQKEQADADATASRWYRKIHRTTRSEPVAPDKILEDARREHQAKLHAKERHRRAIDKKLTQLRAEAKSIITQIVGGYERGSYLLKLTPKRAHE